MKPLAIAATIFAVAWFLVHCAEPPQAASSRAADEPTPARVFVFDASTASPPLPQAAAVVRPSGAAAEGQGTPALSLDVSPSNPGEYAAVIRASEPVDTWLILNWQTRQPVPATLIAEEGRICVLAAPAGDYCVVCNGGAAITNVTLGGGDGPRPQPIPDVDPAPVPPVPVPPVPTPGRRIAVIVYETAERTPAEAAVMNSQEWRDYCRQQDHPFYVVDDDAAGQSEYLRPFVQAAKAVPPSTVARQEQYQEKVCSGGKCYYVTRTRTVNKARAPPVLVISDTDRKILSAVPMPVTSAGIVTAIQKEGG